jgi:hypothetical protein
MVPIFMGQFGYLGPKLGSTGICWKEVRIPKQNAAMEKEHSITQKKYKTKACWELNDAFHNQ